MRDWTWDFVEDDRPLWPGRLRRFEVNPAERARLDALIEEEEKQRKSVKDESRDDIIAKANVIVDARRELNIANGEKDRARTGNS